MFAVLLATLALAAGFGGGLLGASMRSGGQTTEPAAPPAEAPLDLAARTRAAVDRVLPNIVLIVSETPTGESLGSGVVVSQTGNIATAAHVIKGATKIEVVLANGDRRPARLVGDDSPFSDVAVLSVAPQGLRQVAFGASSALRPGDFVLAVGADRGLYGAGGAATMGIVSATNRILPRSGVNLEDLIQIDAAINSGDSGGALVNLNGEFVGMITSVIRDEGPERAVVFGVGFAQSSDSLRPVVAELIRSGRYPRPRIGIERPDEQHLEISPDLAAQRRLPVPNGALIVAPAPNSPTVRAGIQVNDIVIGVNGAKIDFDFPMVNLLKRLPRGARVDLAVLRAGRTITIAVQPDDQ
ncbi:MAG: PDZ domain-containing protein [Chloroflexi bacterium]|nr:PDZ domain-containing protein [Chloroflexota bacterium]